MKDIIRPSLLRGRRTWNFRRLDDAWRNSENKKSADISDQVNMNNLKMQAANVQYYIERFIPQEIKNRFYDIIEEYAHAHDLVAISEMRRAVKSNQFAPANDVKTEEGDAAAAITIRVIAMHPNLKGKLLQRKVEEAREKELGAGHGPIDRSTIHRHKRRFEGANRKRR